MFDRRSRPSAASPSSVAQVLAKLARQPLLELPHALARDAEAIAELLERERVVGHEALVEDGEVLVLADRASCGTRELRP
jgi:hypothetical protein